MRGSSYGRTSSRLAIMPGLSGRMQRNSFLAGMVFVFSFLMIRKQERCVKGSDWET